jgi:hypothetical protein
MRKLILACCLAFAVAACGDNDLAGSGDDDTIDAAPDDGSTGPDAARCTFEAGALGGPCSADVDCESSPGAADGRCLEGVMMPTTFAPEGYCILDNKAGNVCAQDADCGAGGLCVFDSTFNFHFCAPACCDGSACPVHQACWDSFNGSPLDKTACVPGNSTAIDGAPCAGFYECNEFSQCTNDFEHPGGACERYGCTVGDPSTCHGGVCVELVDEPFNGTICVDQCTTDNDCRFVEGYKCFDRDPASTTDQKYCRHPRVGDACTTAADCGTGTWECRTSGFPGGICTQVGCPTPATNEGCTTYSLCYDTGPDNICIERCQTVGVTTGCRSGYTCANVGAENGGGCVPL